MLAERGRRRSDRTRGVGQLHRHPERAELADRRMLDARDHLTRLQLGIVEQLLQVPDRSARHARGREPIDPELTRLGPQPLGHEGPERVIRRDALTVRREPALLGQAGDRAEAAPLLVVADREHEFSVRCRERLVRHDARMAVAEAGRNCAAREIVARLIGQQRRHRVEHRDVDFLPVAGSFPREQRHRHPVGREHPRHDVCDPSADPVMLISPPSACITAS